MALIKFFKVIPGPGLKYMSLMTMGKSLVSSDPFYTHNNKIIGFYMSNVYFEIVFINFGLPLLILVFTCRVHQPLIEIMQ
jgi:hypothetical protein